MGDRARRDPVGDPNEELKKDQSARYSETTTVAPLHFWYTSQKAIICYKLLLHELCCTTYVIYILYFSTNDLDLRQMKTSMCCRLGKKHGEW